MPIKPIGNEIITVPITDKRTEGTKPTLSFQQLLQEASEKRTEKAPLPSEGIFKQNGATVLAPVFQPVPLLSDTQSGLSPVQKQGMDEAEQTLDLLERYRSALADGELSPKNLKTLIDSISAEVERLRGLAKALPSSDPLQKLLTEIGVVSAVTIWKHKRSYLL